MGGSGAAADAGAGAEIGMADTTDKATDAIDRQLKALYEQALMHGWSRDEIDLHRLAQEGATEAQLAYARSVIALRNELEAEAKAVEDAKKREIDAIKEADEIQKEIKDRQDQDRADELNAELDALNKIKAAREETAKKTVGQFIEEAATRKDEQAAADKDRERGERLRERAAKRGVTLSKKDREFLDAFEAIDAAGKGLKEDDPLMQNIKIAQDNLEQLKLDSKTLADMLDALDKANTIAGDARKEMQQLLRAG
jgi:hypothetical protein